MPDRSPSPPTRRVVDIVSLLIAAPEPVTVAGIADRLEIARATATAILAELDSAGWVSRGDGGYHLGPALARLHGPALPRAAGEVLDALAMRTGCGATLSRIEPDQLTVLDVRQGPDRIVPGIPVGHRIPLRFPAGASVMPWRPAAEQNAWLATADPETRRTATVLLNSVRRRGIAVFRPDTDDDAGTVELLADLLAAMGSELRQPHLRTRALRRLAELTSRPYTKSELDSDVSLPLSYLAAPVFDRTGVPAYEIQLGALRTETGKSERDSFIAATVDAARDLSAALADG
ncbi:MarR family transcriptional regulator [Nocardia arthritidis]|uniref:MarR family transcriptional regulator n=1 Tax=Nocardia arthritidis TaxID=228602 RepID=A0A6G9YFR8_9NOCA|nr:MarR family transcriptional regulator [Nocardia arthritidis]QIS11917.1 MarR family transcriptional regulator [Nocardia arthritidis]